jgi:3-deoxy-D-manno-octulosonic-acid transferase
MFIFYDLIFLIFAIFYLPVFLLKKKMHPGFLMRLGWLPKQLKFDRPIWVHAVSVGEVMAVRHLIGELRLTYPGKRFFITTVTATGNKITRAITKEGDYASYLPLDLGFIVKKIVDKVQPSILIIVETELWPNLISYLCRKNIPIMVVNGRISDRSFRGYLSVKLLLKPLLNKVRIFCVQSDSDARRLKRLGVLENKIRITGNMKFDIVDYMNLKKTCLPAGRDYTDYRSRLAVNSKEKLFIAGSTHSGEEEIILNVYKGLLKDYPGLRLLLAPRHPERVTEVEKIVVKFGFEPLRISKLLQAPCLSGRQASSKLQANVFILDTVGQLLSFYAVSDIVFVGGSLIRKGGHNILEPASQGKPILFGPYMFNFRDIAELFCKNQAVIPVRNGQELKTRIRELLNNAPAMEALGRRAKELVSQYKGATGKNADFVRGILQGV